MWPRYPNFEVTPLAAHGRLYLCLKAGVVVALDQRTGRQIWRYTTPDVESYEFDRIFGAKCRGVSLYEASRSLPDCQRRIVFASPDGFLRAVDADTGKLCASFGKSGSIRTKCRPSTI